MGRRRPAQDGTLGFPSRRPVANDSKSIDDAALRIVIRHGVVLHCAIVPKGDRVVTPSKPYLVLGRVSQRVKELEQSRTFVLVHTDDMRGEQAIDINRLESGLR